LQTFRRRAKRHVHMTSSGTFLTVEVDPKAGKLRLAIDGSACELSVEQATHLIDAMLHGMEMIRDAAVGRCEACNAWDGQCPECAAKERSQD